MFPTRCGAEDHAPLDAVNAWLWLSANFISVYAVITLFAFVIFYARFFPWRQYPAGVAQMQLAVALLALSIPSLIAVYIDPQVVPWYIYNENIEPWRPSIRFTGVAYVAYAITNLLHLLWLRKYHPERSPELGVPYMEPKANAPKSKPRSTVPKR